MNTTFSYAGNNLQLCRWPLQQPNTSLQAWDAADELLIEHTQQAAVQFFMQHNRQPNLLIINDSFGALSCALAKYAQVQINDSVLAARGSLYNREQNTLGIANLQQQSSIEPLPNSADIVLLKLPNNHSYLHYILQQLAKVVTTDSIILASAKAKDINRNVLAMFNNCLGEASASLTVKKCRLISCQFNPALRDTETLAFPLRWPLENSPYILINHANVFSREKLDQGARFFLQHLPLVKLNDVVIDLGCGNGVLSLPILAQGKDIQLIYCDESYMAVDSAKMTVAANFPEQLAYCQFVVDDCLSLQADRTADYVLCNPPFHQNQIVTSHIALQMFTDAKRVLKQGGHLRIVANRHLGYSDVLTRLFGNCRQLAADAKFVILEVVKRS
ncbi:MULTISPECIES: methyltransferase [Rheinheimera]|uniref:methyltransferase n=1 Tax=Rheinheimera TaxID=67575 RepID=UPI00104572AD|nr:methyltransferase [Rheinheimera sp. D18]QBL08694.1 methyltransferase domain-containing protein [Rheinheimera sp. D18]